MKKIAYMVEWSDDQIIWRHGSLCWYVGQAILDAETIPYSWRIRKIEINPLDLISEKEYQDGRDINNLFSILK